MPESAHRTCNLTVISVPRLDEQGENRLFFRPKRPQQLVEALDEPDIGSITNRITDLAALVRPQHQRDHDRAGALRWHVPVL